MKKLLIALLLGIFITGCGTAGGNDIAPEPTNDPSNGGGTEEVSSSIQEQGPLSFVYEVKNNTTNDVTLEFTSSQRFDYSIETSDGNEVFLYSSVASFMQALGEETIKQGESMEFPFDLNNINLEPGEYMLKAWMTPKDGNKYESSTKITVE